MRGSWEKMFLSWVLKRHFEAICRLVKYLISSLLIQKLLTQPPPPSSALERKLSLCKFILIIIATSRPLRKSWKDITVLNTVFWYSSCSKFLPKRWQANHLLKLTEIVYISWHNNNIKVKFIVEVDPITVLK